MPKANIDAYKEMARRASEDETVVFAWIVYPSREARDAINAKVFAAR